MVKPQVSGTHTGDLDLTALGLGIIPPSGRAFRLPEETARITVEGARWSITMSIQSQRAACLAQLGVTVPH